MSARRFPDHEISRLRDLNPISSVVGQHVTWDRRKSLPAKGDWWACCPFHAENSPSFHVLDGKGIYHCFGCGSSGDVFRFLQEHLGISFVEAVERLGGRHEETEEDRRRSDARAEERAARQREHEARAAAEEEDTREFCWKLWSEARSLAGTPGEAYLVGRPLPRLDAWPGALRWHPSVWHGPARKRCGAILARVDDVGGSFSGLWRIFITEVGKKAFGGESKLGLGPTKGGAVRLFPATGGRIDVCEGIETGLAIRALSAGVANVWPCLSTSGLMGFEVPIEVSSIHGWPDADLPRWDERREVWSPPPGEAAMKALGARLKDEAVPFIMEPLPPRIRGQKSDFADVWARRQARAAA